MRNTISVGDAMTVNPVVAKPHMTIHDVAVLMDMHNVGSVIIKDGEDLLGLITERDYATRVCLEGYDPVHTAVHKVMTKDLITVDPGMDLFDALLVMKDSDVRHLPVMENSKLVGFVTSKDILKLQPHLFDNFVDMFELREEERKKRRAGVAIIEEDD